jgi:hypothetical protein
MAKFKLKLTERERAFFRKAGRQGGLLSAAARLEKLTPEERSAIATKASMAAKAARAARKKEAAGETAGKRRRTRVA